MASPQADTMTVEASSSGMSTIQAARQTDASLGITEYVGSHEGFSGTMKYRFTDFIVREVPPLSLPISPRCLVSSAMFLLAVFPQLRVHRADR